MRFFGAMTLLFYLLPVLILAYPIAAICCWLVLAVLRFATVEYMLHVIEQRKIAREQRRQPAKASKGQT